MVTTAVDDGVDGFFCFLGMEEAFLRLRWVRRFRRFVDDVVMVGEGSLTTGPIAASAVDSPAVVEIVDLGGEAVD